MEAGGSDNEYLYMVLPLCEGEVESIFDVRVDDKPLAEFNGRFLESYGAIVDGKHMMRCWWQVLLDGQQITI